METGQSTLEQILCRQGGHVAADLVMAAERRVTSSLVITGGTVTSKKYVFSNAKGRDENIGKRASYFRERKLRSKGVSSLPKIMSQSV